MSLTIKCPQCKTLIDASESAPGSTVVCPDCSAVMRVPTGETGDHAKTARQVKGAGPARSTPLFRRMAGARTAPSATSTRPSNFAAGPRGAGARTPRNAGLIAASVVGAIAVVAGLVYLN